MTKQGNNIEFMPIVHIGIWSTIIKDLDTLPLIDRLYKIKSTTPSVVKSNKGGYQTNPTLDDDPVFYPLVGAILEIYTQILSYPNVKLDGMWGNISSFGNYNSTHSHSYEANKLSGVFYLQVPENSGEFEYLNPIDKTLAGYHQPRDKELIIFPSILFHAVAPNFSQEDRISIAFNFS